MQCKWLNAANLVWSVLAGILAVHAFYFPWSHSVYTIYASASRNWWAGQNMYVLFADYYRYSPLFAIAMTPFALLPDSCGGALWKAFNLAVYIAGLRAWTRRGLPMTLRGSQKAVFFLLLLPGSLHSMYNGQANLVMIGAALVGLADVAARRWNCAAGWLAAAALIKGYPLALALLVCAVYPRWFAPRFVVALALGLLFPFCFQRPSFVVGQYANWFSHLTESTALMRERLRSIDHLFEIWGHPLAPRTFGALGVVTGAAILGFCLVHVRRNPSRRELLTWIFSLFAVWAVLFGPATETCTYVLAAPAVAWTLIAAFRRSGAWVARAVLVLSLLMMGPLVTDLLGQTVRNFANAHGSQPVGGLLFLAYLLAKTIQQCIRAALPRAECDFTSVDQNVMTAE